MDETGVARVGHNVWVDLMQSAARKCDMSNAWFGLGYLEDYLPYRCPHGSEEVRSGEVREILVILPIFFAEPERWQRR